MLLTGIPRNAGGEAQRRFRPVQPDQRAVVLADYFVFVRRRMGSARRGGFEINLASGGEDWFILEATRMWRNWQTRYFEVVVP